MPELMTLFTVKHFIADFPLQTTYMLRKSNKDNWVLPLLSHSMVHGIFTLAILLWYIPMYWYLAIVEVAIHFTIDLLKCRKSLLNRWDISESMFWTMLGLDQMIHMLTYIWIIAYITY